MNSHFLANKQLKLFLILAGIFISNALIAEFIGVKIFSLEKTLGIAPFSFSLLGEEGLAFNLTAGVLLWPVVFLLTDVINEYYGMRGVRFLSYLAVALIAYGFLMLYFAIGLEPADFWPTSHIPVVDTNDSLAIQQATLAQAAEAQSKVGDYNYAFRLIFGQGMWIIVGSLVAFLIGQIVDVFVFHEIKKKTGGKMVWLRATGSTIVSQLVDSFVVLFIAFYIGAGWSIGTVLAISLVNFCYKFFVAVLLTPLIYLSHSIIDRYLGVEIAEKLKIEASQAK